MKTTVLCVAFFTALFMIYIMSIFLVKFFGFGPHLAIIEATGMCIIFALLDERVEQAFKDAGK